mgnify:FL=1
MEEKLFVSTKNNDWIESYWNVATGHWQKDNDEKRKIYNKGGFISPYRYPKIERVIYNFKNPNKPATICFFDDGSKVVVRCDEEDFTREGVSLNVTSKKS